jgi:hypothetical protein
MGDKLTCVATGATAISVSMNHPHRHLPVNTQTLVVSVVVPSYARPQGVRRALQAMTELDDPINRFEVIVVDDGSPVSPKEVIAPFRCHLPFYQTGRHLYHWMRRNR